jgi:hypothetical protein
LQHHAFTRNAYSSYQHDDEILTMIDNEMKTIIIFEICPVPLVLVLATVLCLKAMPFLPTHVQV